ncbi:unnamed protein product [Boreogadus saida]
MPYGVESMGCPSTARSWLPSYPAAPGKGKGEKGLGDWVVVMVRVTPVFQGRRTARATGMPGHCSPGPSENRGPGPSGLPGVANRVNRNAGETRIPGISWAEGGHGPRGPKGDEGSMGTRVCPWLERGAGPRRAPGTGVHRDQGPVLARGLPVLGAPRGSMVQRAPGVPGNGGFPGLMGGGVGLQRGVGVPGSKGIPGLTGVPGFARAPWNTGI